MLDRSAEINMEIKVEVEMYSAGGRSYVDVVLTDDDLRTMAENKVLESHACDSCKAKEMELAAVWGR